MGTVPLKSTQERRLLFISLFFLSFSFRFFYIRFPEVLSKHDEINPCLGLSRARCRSIFSQQNQHSSTIIGFGRCPRKQASGESKRRKNPFKTEKTKSRRFFFPG